MRARTADGRRTSGPVAGRPTVLACLLALLVGAAVAPADAQPPGPQEPLDAPVIDGPVGVGAEAPALDAEAWVLMDAATGQVLAERAADERRPVASTIKVLTALTVLERADLDDTVRVGEEVEVGGASVGLSPGDEWTVEQLLDGLVARSGNDAAEALATHVAGDMAGFVELMRQDAAELGLDDVVITEASGLSDGNEVSARDLAVVARAALADPEARPLFARERVELPGRGTVATRNELLGAYPGATGMKTGYTAAAGFGLVASAARDGRELIAVVLGAGEDPGRFQDAIALLDHGFEDFETVEADVAVSLLVAGGRQALTAAPGPIVVPVGAQVGFEGLPPDAPEPGTLPVALTLDGREVARLDAQVGAGPAPVEGTAALGRALVDQAHRGMRRATAEAVW